MKKYKAVIEEKILANYENLEVIFTEVPSIRDGHMAIPCFRYAKILKKAPQDIAVEISRLIESLDFVEKTNCINGYINIFIKLEILSQSVIEDVFYHKEKYGSNQSGMGKTALVEHTSINPNASPHVGRARNAMIGDTVVRILKFEGYEVEVHYFVNDIGKQIAMLLLGSMDMPSVDFNQLLDVYIEINEKAKKDPEIENQVFELLYKLENGDENVRASFRKLVDVCIDGQTGILKKLGIQYDCFDYESDYLFNNTLQGVLDQFSAAGWLEEDEEGRLVLNQSKYELPMKSPYLVLTRKDKTSLYPLRDIAYSIDKAKAGKDRNIIVLGEDQKLYHKQVQAALTDIGYEAPEVVHYAFVMLAEGKMATRSGTVVLLDDFMSQALSKAREEILKRRDTVDEATATAIAYGAVKYSMLKVSSEKSVTFDWDEALSFEGDAGPYLQYSMARINSIERNLAPVDNALVDYTLLILDEEIDIILEMAKMPEMMEVTIRTLSPHHVARYFYTLTQKFSKFYHNVSISGADNEATKHTRLYMILALRQVMMNCFNILGIAYIDEM